MTEHIFEMEQLKNILDSIVGKNLGEIDVNNVFEKTKKYKKITGIAGDVIEQSVLKYPADNKQEPDLKVNGIDIELKTTGLKKTKSRSKYAIEAKEPMSITAVSPSKITKETFEDSLLWHKLKRILFVYYLYDSDKTVIASEYSRFPIQGYDFHEFNDSDKKILKNDWTVVHDFILNLQNTLSDPTKEYPTISHLRNKLIYLDTAPKWPKNPRFRLKRSVVTTIAQKSFGKEFEPLTNKNSFSNLSEFKKTLHDFTELYSGQNIESMSKNLNIEIYRDKNGKATKNINERIITAAFGSAQAKLRNIELFSKMGIIPKNLVQTIKGGRTEDTKFDTVDFSEWTDKNIVFEDSYVYNFFANQTLLFIISKEIYANSPLERNIFEGFKLLKFDDKFINKNIKPTWDEVRRLYWNNDIKVSRMYDKNGNLLFTPKTGLPKTSVNLPKSDNYELFLRGTGKDARNKTLKINGQMMYQQQFWLKGTTLAKNLNELDYI